MSKKSLLVIDDDPITLVLLEHILVREGFEVHKATTGKEAADLFASLEPPADVVLCDVMLPQLGGFELVSMLRGMPGWERVPVVMLTAKGREADIKRAFDAGADDYLVKPFQPGELLARLRRLLR